MILSEVARGRQTNMTSSGSGAGVGYGAASTATAAPREPASSTRDSMGGGGVTCNRTSMGSPSLQLPCGAGAAQPPTAFYDHSTVPPVTNSAPMAP